ncbi:MAG TPA: hypothetical protein VG454_12180 [Gemmatimonadales bacterium]|nr:hypothetical protein [Gemmatimonadales bacterium]
MKYWNKHRSRLVESFSSARGFQSITVTGPIKGSLSGVMELTFPSDALFTNDWLLEQEFRMLLPAIRFERGWQGSLYQTGLFVRTKPGTIKLSAFPLNLRVTGTDRVLVPAGRFDCWRVEVESYMSGADAWTMWISQDRGWLVKAEFRRSDYVRDEVLESYEPLVH